MTPDEMQKVAGQYRTEAGNIEGVIKNMDKLLTTLQDQWKGSASDAYADKYHSLRPSFKDAEQLVNDIATALDKTRQAVVQQDSQIASAFKK
jgi:WXG100 family type VII secretion target